MKLDLKSETVREQLLQQVDVGKACARGPPQVEEVEVRVLRRGLRPEQPPEEACGAKTCQK